MTETAIYIINSITLLIIGPVQFVGILYLAYKNNKLSKQNKAYYMHLHATYNYMEQEYETFNATANAKFNYNSKNN
jgi:hypothetical protein